LISAASGRIDGYFGFAPERKVRTPNPFGFAPERRKAMVGNAHSLE